MPTAFTAHFAAKKALKILSKSDTFTYDGTPHVASDTTFEGDNDVAVYGVTARAEETNAGTYPVTFRDKDKLEIKEAETGKDVTDQYAVTYEEGTLTIEKRPIALTGEGWSESQQYTGKAYTSDQYKVELPSGYNDRQPGGTSGLVQGQSVSTQYRISGMVPGMYEGSFEAISILDGDSDVAANYTISTTVGALEIVASQKPLVITAVSKSWKYDGKTHSDSGYTISYGGSVVARNEDGSYTLPTGDTVTAKVSGSVKNVADGTEGNNEITGFEVGNSSYYANVSSENGTLTITPRSVDLTSAAATKPYDGSPLTASDITVSGDGWVAGEGADYAVTGSQTAVGSSDNTFDYTLKDGTTAANYVIAKHVNTLTVTSRPDDAKFEITVEANSGTFTYDGTEQSVSGLKQTEFTIGDVTFTVTDLEAGATGTNANAYDANVTGNPVVTDEGGNVVTDQFLIKTKNGSLVIEKRSLTLTSATLSKVYDGTPLATGDTALAVEEGWAEDEGATYEFANSVSQPGETKSNDFAVVPNDGTSLDNYDVTKTAGQLTIKNRDAKYDVDVTASSGTFTYDGTEKTVSGFERETDRGVPVVADGRTYYVKGLTSAASGTNVSDSVASVPVGGAASVFDESGEDVSSEFNVAVNPGSLTINKRSVVLTSESGQKPYDGYPLTNDAVNVSGDGWAEGEGATYQVTGSQTLVGSSDNVFTYALTNGAIEDNYAIETLFGTLRVANAEARFEVTVTANSDTATYDGDRPGRAGAGKRAGILRYGVDSRCRAHRRR